MFEDVIKLQILHDELIAMHKIAHSSLMITCVTLLYSLFKGGMRAVIWTDVFQFVVMIGGLLAVIIKVRPKNPTETSEED